MQATMGGPIMSKAPQQKNSARGLTTKPEYCHPLTLQNLPPHRFQKRVRDILEGKLTLLISRRSVIKEQIV